MVPERIYLPDCRRRTELRARYRNDCRIVTLRPEKGFQQTELTVEDPVGRMDIREEMEMANRTVVHKSRRRGICIVLREVTIVLIGMGMQAFCRIPAIPGSVNVTSKAASRISSSAPALNTRMSFCPLISGAKIMKKGYPARCTLPNTYILGCFCRESNINISNPKHTLFLGYKRTQAPNLFEWSI
mgnify:CR=1 FL=1